MGNHEVVIFVRSLGHSIRHMEVGDGQVNVHDSVEGYNLLVVEDHDDQSTRLVVDHNDLDRAVNVGDNFGDLARLGSVK